jgi:hypothetical protein
MNIKRCFNKASLNCSSLALLILIYASLKALRSLATKPEAYAFRGTKVLSIMTLIIKAFSITTLSVMTLSITTFGVMTLSIKTSITMPSVVQYFYNVMLIVVIDECHYAECCYAECR